MKIITPTEIDTIAWEGCQFTPDNVPVIYG
jgi:hypothetical protein